MKMIQSFFVVTILLAFPAWALALGEESFGNDPAVKQPDWAVGVVDVVNLKSRVYSRWVNGNESFFYRGGARALAEALEKFAAINDDVRELVLLPGTGKTQSFQGQAVEFDWNFHVPSGIYRAASKRTHAVLTVYVNGMKPRPPDKKSVEKWLTDLNSETFKTRDAADRELQKLGHDAKPLLRDALKSQPTAESRHRIETLLDKLSGLDVTDLDIPKGVAVVTADDLVAARLKNLNDADRTVRGLAILDLQSLAPYSDKVAPAVIESFKQDKNDHVHRMAAYCLAQMEVPAKDVVPTLKMAANDPDATIRDASKKALERIESAKDVPGRAERVQREVAILKEISEFKKAVSQ